MGAHGVVFSFPSRELRLVDSQAFKKLFDDS